MISHHYLLIYESKVQHLYVCLCVCIYVSVCLSFERNAIELTNISCCVKFYTKENGYFKVNFD